MNKLQDVLCSAGWLCVYTTILHLHKEKHIFFFIFIPVIV